MSTTINFTEKDKEQLLSEFNLGSQTDGMFSTGLDMEFSGSRTVHVRNLPTYDLQDYDRSKKVGTGSRYGDTEEVGDEVQTFEMGQDKSLSLSIDKGNNKDEFNMKSAGKVMHNETEQVIKPYLDKYRLQKWADQAGIHFDCAAALTNKNICEKIIDLHDLVVDSGVPDDLTLSITRGNLKHIKLSPEWVGLDACGGKSLPSGAIGMFDGMAVKPIRKKDMPHDVEFMITYKAALIAPMKIKDFKGHVDPPGLSGDLLEFRMYHDAFVVGVWANGCAVGCANGKVLAAPNISCPSGTATVTAGDGASIKYTLDGSDPRYSKTAVAYTTTVHVESGETIKAYAFGGASGKYASAVAEFKYTA